MMTGYGTRDTGEEAWLQLKNSCKSVTSMNGPEDVWKTWPKDSLKATYLGLLRRLQNMPIVGRTNRRRTMTSKSARGFLMLSLNNEQISKVHEKEKQLPEGRYLAPWEISKYFKIQTKEKDDQQLSLMESLEREHNKMLWKDRNLREIGKFQSKTDWEELHEWDQYIQENWNFADGVKGDY